MCGTIWYSGERPVSRIGTETYASNYSPSKMTGFESEGVGSCDNDKFETNLSG